MLNRVPSKMKRTDHRASGRPRVQKRQVREWEANVKMLSIRQPWAYLIVHGAKDVENRVWSTKHRGQILVHASVNIDHQACWKHGLDPSKLQIGGIIGIAEITDCVEDHDSRWFEGPYGFVLRNRRPLPFVKWMGSLGLRDAPSRLLKRLGLQSSNSLQR
jgi:ASCH domain